jgi:hypothetical protein
VAWLSCPYLGADVELTEERWAHIRDRHRYFKAHERSLNGGLLERPDEVRQRSTESDEFLLVRRFQELVPGIAVAVIRFDRTNTRWWVVTAYRSDEWPQVGDVLWTNDEN